MKGHIVLTVDIDYGELLNAENVKAIKLFTGKDSIEEIKDEHMKKLGSELEEFVKNKPLITYRLDGYYVNDSDLDSPDKFDNPYADVEEVEDEEFDESEIEELVEVEELAEVEEVGNYINDIVEGLEKKINEISKEDGIIDCVVVNSTMHDIMKGYYNVPENESINRILGFPLTIEGMEEMYRISYKDYDNGEEFIYVSANNNIEEVQS